MHGRQYDVLKIIEEACGLIPEDFKKSNHAEIACLTKLFRVKKEELHEYYSRLNAQQQKNIRDAVKSISQLLLLTLKKESDNTKHYATIYDALRLLNCYF